jgi:hypothetical protein
MEKRFLKLNLNKTKILFRFYLKGLRKSCLSNELSRFISLCAAGLQDK